MQNFQNRICKYKYMFFQDLYENMTLRSNPLGGEDFVSDLQNNPQTSEGEKSGSSPFSKETYVDYHGKYTTKLKMFFPNATDDQIEALIYFKKNGMQKEFRKLYKKLSFIKSYADPEFRRKRLEYNKQKYANDSEWRRKILDSNKRRYVNDPELRKKELEYNKQKYANDPEYRRKRLEFNKRRYANDPEFRKKGLERKRLRYANDPEIRRKRSEQNMQYRRLKKLGTFNQFVQDKNPEV